MSLLDSMVMEKLQQIKGRKFGKPLTFFVSKTSPIPKGKSDIKVESVIVYTWGELEDLKQKTLDGTYDSIDLNWQLMGYILENMGMLY